MSNTIVASLGDVVLYSEDVDTLDEWLNDQIIDFYFEHLSQRFSPSSGGSADDEGGEAEEGEKGSKPSTTVFVGASASFLCAHGGASAVAGPLQLAKADLVFLPVNDNRNLSRAGGGSHWSLLVFDREGGEVGTAGGGGGGGEEESTSSNGGGGAEREKKAGAENDKAAAGSSVRPLPPPSSPSKTTTTATTTKPKPVFRAYDSLGYKNMVCARELSSALEEHLILDDDEEEEDEGAARGGGGKPSAADNDAAEERSRRLRQRRRLDAAASRTRSVAPTRVLNFVQGRCPRQGNASDCGIYILALAERIAAGRAKGLPYREIEEQLFREVTPSFAEEERERLRLLVEEVGRGRSGGDKKDDDENNNNAAVAAAAPKKKAAPKKAPKKKGG